MKNYKIHMTERADRQCRQVISLFSDFLKEKELCIVKSEEYGYIFLSDITQGAFDYNAICHTANELFNEIIFIWDAYYLYDIAVANKSENTKMSEPILSLAQQNVFDNIKIHLNLELEKILIK